MSATEEVRRPDGFQPRGRVIIVGGSLAGSTVANRLRTSGYAGEILVIDDDSNAPYDRPPLSKKLLDGGELATRANWAADDVVSIRGHAVSFVAATRNVQIDTAGKISDVTGDYIVIATGAEARHLPFEPPGVAVLRTAEDAVALRALVNKGARSAVIIGAGAIGTELASVFCDRGLEVTIVDAVELPLMRLLGPLVAHQAAQWIEDAGVRLVMNADVSAIHGLDSGWMIELASGDTISADILVSAVGSLPRVGWLANSGVLIDNGIRCDGEGRVLGSDGAVLGGVFAVGDVAAWDDARAERVFRRSEAWDSAQRQGNDVAATILGKAKEPRPRFDYFWTDQFARKIQVLGAPALGDRVETVLERKERNAAVYRIARRDETVAWVTINAPREFAELARSGLLASLATAPRIEAKG
jgi:3-phenylpropionate/trans-cinnamate dioxygenase ferredoxin reductase subunit